jgi:beta-lactamase regulating signal transducer with metallopeptidase domain
MNWYALNHFAAHLLSGLFDVSVRSVALAANGAGAVAFLRKNSTAQHTVWTAVLMGMLALPILYPWIPAVPVPVQQFRAVHPISLSGSVTAAAVHPGPIPPAPEPFRPRWQFYAALAYVGGALIFFVRLILGLLGARRLLRSTRPVQANGTMAWESDRVRVPLAAGFFRPCIILPMDWRGWPEDKLLAVLAHEYAHLRRRDLPIRLAAAINKGIFWFHPVAWWLEQRLSLLAEEAADDAGLAVSRNPESYARVLLEIASRMENQKSRLLWPVSAINGPLLAQRIHRVLEAGARLPGKQIGKKARALVWSSAALLIWFSAALQFQGAARAQAHAGFLTDGRRSDSNTPQEAARMERRLAANPEDEGTRSRLLHYYWAHGMREQRVPLILWLIDHHPESALHGYLIASISPRGREGDPLAFQDARNRWLTQVNRHPNNPQVLANAARTLVSGNLQEGIDLEKRAQIADPAGMTASLAYEYAVVLIFSANLEARDLNPFRDPAVAAQIREELLNSNDAALVGAVAHNLVERLTERMIEGDRGLDLDRLRLIAMELTARAQTLEPKNRAWADLREGARRIAHQ